MSEIAKTSTCTFFQILLILMKNKRRKLYHKGKNLLIKKSLQKKCSHIVVLGPISWRKSRNFCVARCIQIYNEFNYWRILAFFNKRHENLCWRSASKTGAFSRLWPSKARLYRHWASKGQFLASNRRWKPIFISFETFEKEEEYNQDETAFQRLFTTNSYSNEMTIRTNYLVQIGVVKSFAAIIIGWNSCK